MAKMPGLSRMLALVATLLALFAPSLGNQPLHPSYYPKTPDVPLECACGDGITKVVIQELNRTVMIPEFVDLPKTFARVVGEERVAVPMFSDYPEEILEEKIEERHVDVFNVEYFWKEVQKRTPVYNNTKLLVDRFTLVPTPFVNQTVRVTPKEVYNTKVEEDTYEVDDWEIVYNETEIYYDKIEYEDYEVVVEQVFFQDVTKIVEVIKYVDTEVYVWEIQTYDTELLEKKVVPRTLDDVQVDEITINPKPVKVPRLKYSSKLVIVHDPVTYINEPVSTPEFYNQTYKVAKEIRKTIPVPNFRRIPVEEPTYFKKACALEKNAGSFMPSTCSCNTCAPCTVCPGGGQRNQRSYASNDNEELGAQPNPNNFFQYGVAPSAPNTQGSRNLPQTHFQQSIISNQNNNYNGENPENLNDDNGDNQYDDEDPYEPESSHVIEKKSVDSKPGADGQGEGDPWAYWMPTIMAYRAKFGL